jgi:hypothetical protein
MTRVYARTREREKAWKWGAYAAGASLVAAPLISIIFNGWQQSTFAEILWTFSIILESVCVLPQLILLRQTTVPTVIDSFYLVTLGSYRAFYLLNWIYRAFTPSKPDLISVIFGIVQTAFYLDFAWVYWTRQRVKLRGGGVVDADDLSKGWLVDRVTKHVRQPADEETDPEVGDADSDGQPKQSQTVNRWGPRGISISADDTLNEHDKANRAGKQPVPEDDPMLNDDAFASDEDDDAPELDEPGKKILSSNEEWQKDSTTAR